jgi:hypothetical protein
MWPATNHDLCGSADCTSRQSWHSTARTMPAQRLSPPAPMLWAYPKAPVCLVGVDPQHLGEGVHVTEAASHGEATDVSRGATGTEEERLHTVGLDHTDDRGNINTAGGGGGGGGAGRESGEA